MAGGKPRRNPDLPPSAGRSPRRNSSWPFSPKSMIPEYVTRIRAPSWVSKVVRTSRTATPSSAYSQPVATDCSNLAANSGPDDFAAGRIEVQPDSFGHRSDDFGLAGQHACIRKNVFQPVVERCLLISSCYPETVIDRAGARKLGENCYERPCERRRLECRGHRLHRGPGDRPFEEQHTAISIAVVMEGTFQYRSDCCSEVMSPGSPLLGNYGRN